MKFKISTISLSLAALIGVFSCDDKGTDPPPVNQAPNITSSISVEAFADSLFSYTATATDPNGTTPTIIIENNPSWTSVNGAAVGGTPSESTPDTSFMVIASDGELADTAVVSVAVVASQTLTSYSGEIQPIFNNNCAGGGCHVGGMANGLSLSSYSSLMQGGNSGAVVVPGNPNSSIIIRRLEGDITPQMPFGRAPLSASDIQKIRDWIEEGALDN